LLSAYLLHEVRKTAFRKHKEEKYTISEISTRKNINKVLKLGQERENTFFLQNMVEGKRIYTWHRSRNLCACGDL
jgi:hypothetical protein